MADHARHPTVSSPGGVGDLHFPHRHGRQNRRAQGTVVADFQGPAMSHDLGERRVVDQCVSCLKCEVDLCTEDIKVSCMLAASASFTDEKSTEALVFAFFRGRSTTIMVPNCVERTHQRHIPKLQLRNFHLSFQPSAAGSSSRQHFSPRLPPVGAEPSCVHQRFTFELHFLIHHSFNVSSQPPGSRLLIFGCK
jgi:hypothetical protein